jgi:hypothetical protein
MWSKQILKPNFITLGFFFFSLFSFLFLYIRVLSGFLSARLSLSRACPLRTLLWQVSGLRLWCRLLPPYCCASLSSRIWSAVRNAERRVENKEEENKNKKQAGCRGVQSSRIRVGNVFFFFFRLLVFCCLQICSSNFHSLHLPKRRHS